MAINKCVLYDRCGCPPCVQAFNFLVLNTQLIASVVPKP